jgi:hypothetical protein
MQVTRTSFGGLGEQTSFCHVICRGRGGPRILTKGMLHHNFGVSIDNNFVLKYKEENTIMNNDKMIKKSDFASYNKKSKLPDTCTVEVVLYTY